MLETENSNRQSRKRELSFLPCVLSFLKSAIFTRDEDRMSKTIRNRRYCSIACRAGVAVVAALAIAGLATASATAQSWPDRNSNSRDSVTGYLCVDPGCSTLRLPGSKCLCQKQNPWEQNVRRLRLKCYEVTFGKVRACPVKSKYGINE